MPPRTRNFASIPDRPSFLEELYQGRFRWDLIHPFPEQDLADRAQGDAAVAALDVFLRDHVDPVSVEAAGRLPDGFLTELSARGYLKLQLAPELGGLGLSHFNTFRMVEAAASWCFPVGLVMGIENFAGVPLYWPIVDEGPLKQLLGKHLAAGGLSGTADTEPTGAANQRRFTTAEPVDDGAAYVLNGSKIHVGHAPIGEMFGVTATVRDGNGTEVNRMFFVEASSPGFHRGGWQEFAGIRGFPNGWITLDNVRVPASQQLIEATSEHQSRMTPATSRLLVRGRVHMIAAPSLAVSKLCLRWARDFVNRRAVDGRNLGEYEEIQRQVAQSLSETFAVESIARAALIPEDLGLRRNSMFEQNVTKNISSVTAWRITDRTLSLLAGEGYETAPSKARRGAPALPVEQAFRDVRNMRVSGGVDFQIDNWTAGRTILSYYYPLPDDPAEAADPLSALDLEGTVLTGRNRAHLEAVAAEVHRFGGTCRDLALRHPERERLAARERVLILLARISNELLTMSVTLARASQMAVTAGAEGHRDGQRLADLYCTTARHRLADLWHQLDQAGDDADADFVGASADWLAAADPAHLADGLITAADTATATPVPTGH